VPVEKYSLYRLTIVAEGIRTLKNSTMIFRWFP
jgi:hypothetical protein